MRELHVWCVPSEELIDDGLDIDVAAAAAMLLGAVTCDVLGVAFDVCSRSRSTLLKTMKRALNTHSAGAKKQNSYPRQKDNRSEIKTSRSTYSSFFDFDFNQNTIQ